MMRAFLIPLLALVLAVSPAAAAYIELLPQGHDMAAAVMDHDGADCADCDSGDTGMADCGADCQLVCAASMVLVPPAQAEQVTIYGDAMEREQAPDDRITGLSPENITPPPRISELAHVH